MNALLKIVVDEAFDVVTATEDAVKKDWTGAAANVLAAIEEAPSLVSNLPDAKAELQALLADPSADADLVTYVEGKLSTAGLAAKPLAIVSASADLGVYALGAQPKVAALIAAFKS